MEETCHSSAPTAATAAFNGSSNRSDNLSSGNHQNTLRLLNKSSHKISKPATATTIPKLHHPNHSLSSTTTSTGEDHPNPDHNSQAQHHPPPPPPPDQASQQPQKSQPPVYNINKNDFRDVVQMLTGSPARHSYHQQQQRASSPPPVNSPTKPTPSSRLQKIRPPPLAHLIPHPTPLAQVAAGCDMAPNAFPVPGIGGGSSRGSGWMRPAPLSPLPPFPTVSAAAESPISSYLRCLQGGSGIIGGGAPFLPSPGSLAASVLPLPSSSLGFDCVPSPPSAGYPSTLSPGLPFPP